MADALKDFFDKARVALLADELARAWPAFPRAAFVREATRGLDALELLDRGRHIAAAMARALPPAYPDALAIVLRSLGPPLGSASGNGMAPFHYLPHTVFVAERGLDHPELSLDAQRELTKRFSCEFSIRFYILRHPELTMATLARWTKDPDEHVRRLVSEGTRPRLPWAQRLPLFQRDPTPVLALLETLRDDPSEYVRRSVANNLNDVAKDHPALVVATCERWLRGATPERRKLVLHALRTLVKRGDADAIRLLGGTSSARFRVTGRIEPPRPRIGGNVRVRVALRNASRSSAKAVLALRIHFVKASGKTSPKTFRMSSPELAPGAAAEVAKTISLRQHTTRTHHPGRHAVEVVVNGKAMPLGTFDLRG